MSSSTPLTKTELLRLLGEMGIETKTHDHPAVFTVDESHRIKEKIPGGHTKNLFLKDKKGARFLVVALNDTNIDLKTLHKKIGCGRLSFGNAGLLLQLLGVTPGSVTPFSLINDTRNEVGLILDQKMMSLDLLNYHPLENTATTSIKRDDLLAFFQKTGHNPLTLELADTDVPME